MFDSSSSALQTGSPGLTPWPRRMAHTVSRATCWWFGCSPDWDKAQREQMRRRTPWGHFYTESVITTVPCRRCSECDVSYESLAGLSRHKRAKEVLGYWLVNRWLPPKCCCGCRGVHVETDACLPF